ncbi:MAG TPA: HEPN domain-containing protein [Actinomycetota bacterium]|nr:HEPN domain-containing protein [Actinomycetota bacterium]
MSGQGDAQDPPGLRWLRLAQEDLTVARHTAADPELVARAACTWAHQSAEKALKALMVAEGIDPPKSHDLIRLSGWLDVGLHARLDSLDLAELTRWAIEGRYPDEFVEATEADAERAVHTAEDVLAIVAEHLMFGGRPAGDS